MSMMYDSLTKDMLEEHKTLHYHNHTIFTKDLAAISAVDKNQQFGFHKI